MNRAPESGQPTAVQCWTNTPLIERKKSKNQALNRNVFRDRKTRIDFVLVWEELRGANENGTGDGAIQRKWREQFLSRLKQVGLLQEQVSKTNTPESEVKPKQSDVSVKRLPLIGCEEEGIPHRDASTVVLDRCSREVVKAKKRIHFVLLSAPWRVLCYFAEEINLKVPLEAGLLFDNWGTVFLSLFMSLWAVTFLEYWRRTSSTLSHRWGCSDFEDIEERPRPEFSAMAPMTTRNPITGAEEPYFPENKRFNRTMTGCMVIIVMVTLLIFSVIHHKLEYKISVVPIFLIAIILYRTILRIFLYKSTTTDSSSAGTIASISASVLNLIIILTLSRIYTWLAGVLTRWAGGCLIDLAQELLVIMVGKQMINNVHEFISPKVQAWWQRNKMRRPQMGVEGPQTMMKVSPWEADYDLLVCEGLFGEYLEMVLQFGFITIFVAACPLAPLFALMNNWVEIRLDAQKYVKEYRRPVVERAQDIGIWFHILQFISHIAVISNAFLISFTSSFVPRMYYRYTRNSTLTGFVNFTLATAPLNHNTTCKYRGFRDDNGEYLPEYFHLIAIRLSFVVVFEHVVFFIGRLIDLIVSNIPEEVELKIKREHYMAKQALAENKALGKSITPNEKDVMSNFVLVWEELRGANENGPGDGAIQRKWREQFLSRLKQVGLLQEHRVVSQIRRKIHFILLSAPWRILCYYAEEISLRAPLQVVTIPITNWSEHFLSKLSLPSPLSQDVPNPPPDYYTCQFRANKLERSAASPSSVWDQTSFCCSITCPLSAGSWELYEILARTPYGCVNRGEVGIDRLISEAVFTAAYPLHEGHYRMPDEPVPPESLGPRQILNEYWSKWSCWRRYQPLDHIREYFGEKIALYFAWIAQCSCFMRLKLCDFPAVPVLLPLSVSFVSLQAGLLFDNWGTVFLSFFMSLWAVTFLEYWKRTCSYLSHRWDCTDLEDIEERPRPEFSAMAPMTTRNPITGAEEPYFPENKRFNRTMTGCMVIILMVTLLIFSVILIIMVAVVLMFLIAIILYRTIISVVIYKSAIYKSARTNTFFGISVSPRTAAFLQMFSQSVQKVQIPEYAAMRDTLCSDPGFCSQAVTIASLSGSVLNLLVILMLSRIYTTLADFLTRWEMHRTQTKYEDMFILKVFIFQFVNFYSTPVYIAFFKGRFVGYPGMYNTLFGIRNEACGVGGCLIDLAQELLIIMVGKQIINNIEEFVSPKVKVWWQKNKLQPLLTNKTGEGTQTMMKVSPWEADYDLLVCEGLFGEYLEMVLLFSVLQFGFITIFVAACPLAPLFALMNNWVEIRLDAQKFVTQYRRPVVERAQDIGIWFHILQFITHIAVISNAFLIAFTSSFVPRLYYRFTRNSTLSGFVNFTLATATETHIQQGHNISCRYRGIRDEKGDYLPEFYELLVVRLSFVIVFEHVVFFINRLIDLIVPDIPEDVELKMKREHYMAKQALAENKALGKTSIPNEKDIVLGDIQHHGSRGLLQWNDRRPTTVKKVTEKRNSSKQLEARLHQN
ncbi:hypothetical protein CCH79_00018340 [Gambusia affinis]|uniref:Anoctamin n=1 Tax=Gambusia affinis TaxID=33528 RepID=A0A315V955_GAMAF|nr:hypothetical protein CCH79_00018340 [Gambusia affinis]